MLYNGPLHFFANHLTIIGEKHICEKNHGCLPLTENNILLIIGIIS